MNFVVSFFVCLFVCLFFGKEFGTIIFSCLSDADPLPWRWFWLGAQSSYKGGRAQWNREEIGAEATRVSFHFSVGFATQLCARQNRHATQDRSVRRHTNYSKRPPIEAGSFSLLLPQSPSSFTALARLYGYFAHPTKTAMLQMQAGYRVMYNQISAVRVNKNKYAHQLQTGFVRYMILKLLGNETRSSCDNRLFFFLSAPCPSLSPFAANYLELEKFLWNPG